MYVKKWKGHNNSYFARGVHAITENRMFGTHNIRIVLYRFGTDNEFVTPTTLSFRTVQDAVCISII